MKILLSLESGEVWTRSKGLADGLMALDTKPPKTSFCLRTGGNYSLEYIDSHI
jgi:hypothetical protein